MEQGNLFQKDINLKEDSHLTLWKPVFHISELYDFVDLLITRNPYLDNIVVIGEISKIKAHDNHLYIDLQDQTEGRAKKRMEKLSCILFNYKSVLSPEQVQALKEGILVRVLGKLEVFRGRGTLSLRVKKIERELSLGWMEKRKRELYEWIKRQGLDRPERKKPLPRYIWRVAVVTSEQGAVIHDIKQTIWRRNPLIEIILVPCAVQGERVVYEVPMSLRFADQLQADVVILARGGGSPEELWYFNEQEILLAVAGMKTPVISAIGHEIDKPLVDLVADKEAPTPTAAAELVSLPLEEIYSELEKYKDSLSNKIKELVKNNQSILKILNLQLKQYFTNFFHQQIRKIHTLHSHVETQFTFCFHKKEKYLNSLREKHKFLFSNRISLSRARLKTYQPQLERAFLSFLKDEKVRQKDLRESLTLVFQRHWKEVKEKNQRFFLTLHSVFGFYLQKSQRDVSQLREELMHAFRYFLIQKKEKVSHIRSLLNSCDYRSVLERGFVLVYQSDQRVARYKQFHPEEPYRLQWVDGVFEANHGMKNQGEKREEKMRHG